MRTAAYLRYSSDNQRDASLDDQLRNIVAWCSRSGMATPEVYADAAISGSRDDRPQYQRLLSDANSGRIDIILVDDLTRLGRDSIEIAKVVKRLKFSGVRLVGVTDGVDTERKGHKIEVGLRGLMSELYLDDLAEKTHRGLAGRALAGASAGGLPFGYIVTETGQRAIHPQQAEVVRRIFELAANGHSSRAIAEILNAEHVPTARGGTWSMSAIHGDHKRGIGILANQMYVGRWIWNRSHFQKHPETGRRIRIERPEREWIIHDHPELAIVSQSLWDEAQRVTKARRNGSPKSIGGRTKHLLSGILRCGQCGGAMVVVDRYRYGCGRAKDKGATICTSKTRFPRESAERVVLDTIRQDLLTPEAFQEFERETRAALKRAAPDTSAAQRNMAKAHRERDNIMAAIRAGIITPTTKAELNRAETAAAAAQSELDAAMEWQPAQFLPRAKEIWKRCVENLSEVRDAPEARKAIRDLVGEQLTVREAANGTVIIESDCQISLVAGAGFGQYLTRPIRIELPRS